MTGQRTSCLFIVSMTSRVIGEYAAGSTTYQHWDTLFTRNLYQHDSQLGVEMASLHAADTDLLS